MNKNRTLSWIVVLTLLILGASWYVRKYKLAPDLPAYEQQLTDENGNKVSISGLRGKYVLVSYFQTWCADCIREIPSIEKLQSAVGRDKLEVLLVSDEPEEKMKRFRDKHARSLKVYTSPVPLKEQGINVYPTTYLLDKNGVVIRTEMERFDWSSEEIVMLMK